MGSCTKITVSSIVSYHSASKFNPILTHNAVATPGIPLGWNLAETLNGMGNALHRPQSMMARPVCPNGTIANTATDAAICEWLKKQKGSPPLDACRQYYVETKSQMVNGTGSWILQNEQFRAWKDPTSLSTKLALEGIRKHSQRNI